MSQSIKPEATVAGVAGSAEGQWRGKALVRNLQNSKSGTINIDIIAKEPAQMRMEVTGSMGIYLASFALNGERVQYILAQKKKFVTAPADAGALLELVPIRISPSDLVRVLFDRSLPKAEWTCEHADAMARCEHRGDGIRVSWLERSGGHRKFKIESKTAEATLVLDEARSKVESSSEIFSLSAPPGYSKEIRPAYL